MNFDDDLEKTSKDMAIQKARKVAMTKFGFIVSAGAVIAALGFGLRLRFWLAGARETQLLSMKVRLREFVQRVIVQKSFRSGGWRAPLMHGLLFWGVAGLLFSVALMTMLALAPRFVVAFPSLYSVIFCFRELSALALLVGALMAIRRRYVKRWIRLPLDLPGDHLALGSLLATVLTGIFSVAARLALHPTPNFEFFVAAPLAALLRNAELASASLLIHSQTVHAVCVAAFLALMPFTRMRHIFVSPFMTLLALRDFEIKPQPTRLSWAERMQLDACSACGRCDVACAAALGQDALSPMQILLAQRDDEHAPTIRDETLLRCTFCGDCETACPIAIAQRPRIASLQAQRGLSRAISTAARVA